MEDKTDKDKINIIKCKDSSLIPNVVISNSCTRKLYIERMNEKEEILKNGRKVWTVVNGQWIVTHSKK